MKKLWGLVLGLALLAPFEARADWCYSYDTSPTYNGSGERVPQNCGLYGQTKVMIVDSSGAVAAIGGGTQYTEGDTDASITGNAILWEDAANTLRVPSATYPLPVNIISGAGSGGTAMADDAAFTAGTTSVTPIGGVFDDTTPDSVDEGDAGAVRMSANRNLYSTIRDAAGNERGVNVNASNELLTNANTELPAAAALADNTANPTVPGVAAFLMCYDGSTWDRCQGGLTDTDDGTVAGSQVPSLTLVIPYEHDGTNWTRVRGQNTVAHDAADAGNPLKIGAKAESSISGATAVADGDRTNLYAGLDGVLIVRPHSNLEDRVSGTAGITDGSSTSVVAAQGAGIRFCATMIVVSNSSATNVTVDIRDGTAGTVLMTIPAAANMGGGAIPLQTPLCTTANTIFAADPSASASTVAVTAVGFKTAL